MQAGSPVKHSVVKVGRLHDADHIQSAAEASAAANLLDKQKHT